MIVQLLLAIHTARKGLLCLTTALGLLAMTVAPSARAATVDLEPASVVPNDTFRPEIVGYNQSFTSQNVYLAANNLNPTFGTTTSYANSALNGQTLTISSVQYVSGNLFNNFISFSVPTNFVPAGTTDSGGHALNGIQFSIGNYFIPTGGTGNPLDFNPALTSFSVTGTVTFVNNGVTTSGAVPMTTMLTNGSTSLSTFGAITSTTDISNSQITAFSILVTYPVPEPSTYALFALGAAGMWLVVVRRRRA